MQVNGIPIWASYLPLSNLSLQFLMHVKKSTAILLLSELFITKDLATSVAGGGGKLYGSIVVEGNMAGMNSNSVLNYSSSYVNIASEPLLGVQAKLPGTWFDR